ncbi:MAG: tRNA 2-thiouridine(34) synthase MnmA [bacterium]|nr:tRNA 2-thiouridine(34) synthase MnmA [bacterium]
MARASVVVAMSGGVDSSVAAALLKKQGYRVQGVFLRTWFDHSIDPEAENRCCSTADAEAARRVAHKLGIEFHVLNTLVDFKKHIVDYFIRELREGNTPNPCIPCNRLIRFSVLMRKARTLGADYLATGHYIHLARKKGGAVTVFRGKDGAKDQSYFHYTLTQEKLRHTLYPVGHYTKPEVRAMARKYALPTAEKSESQDLCFIPKGKYYDFLSKYLDLRPGVIQSADGRTLGQHKGLPLYTIGQREGLNIGDGGGPYYVVEKNAKTNTLIVAPKSSVNNFYIKEFRIKEVNFVSGKSPKLPFRCEVQTRYRQASVPATLVRLGQRYVIQLKSPQAAVTPGQSAVLYSGKQLIGGGVIAG